jgi:hypothetical protein
VCRADLRVASVVRSSGRGEVATMAREMVNLLWTRLLLDD